MNFKGIEVRALYTNYLRTIKSNRLVNKVNPRVSNPTNIPYIQSTQIPNNHRAYLSNNRPTSQGVFSFFKIPCEKPNLKKAHNKINSTIKTHNNKSYYEVQLMWNTRIELALYLYRLLLIQKNAQRKHSLKYAKKLARKNKVRQVYNAQKKKKLRYEYNRFFAIKAGFLSTTKIQSNAPIIK